MPIPCFGSVHRGCQPLIQLHTHPGAFCLCSQAAGTYQGACPPGVSGVGPRPLFGVCTHWGTLCLALRQLGRLSGLTLTRGFRCGPLRCEPAGLQVRDGTAFPLSQSKGGGERGARGCGCCREFSNYPLIASIFFSFLRNSSYSSPPGPNKHLAAHTAQPGSLPQILQ